MKTVTRIFVGVAIVCLCTGAASPVRAKGLSVLIPQTSVSTYTPEDNHLGSYFLLPFDLPSGLAGQELDAALLEFYVTVDAHGRSAELYPANDPEKPSEFVNDAPTLEVFAPNASFTGDLGTGKLDLGSRTAVPIALGEDRHIVVDITHIIQPILDGNAVNYGLVVGSLTGMREGDFSLRSGALGAGAVARIRFYLAPQE